MILLLYEFGECRDPVRLTWNLTNLDPLVWRWSLPPLLLTLQSSAGHMMSGMKAVDPIGWYVSLPHWSHVYVATCSSGFTSVARTTIPRMCTSRPIDDALTSRIGIDLQSADALNITSYRRISSGGKTFLLCRAQHNR